MSGHSHWAGIKYKKALADAKRGKVFSKIARKITLAAKTGGADTDTNLDLRYAIEEARAANMPKDNVARAIKKGLGNLPGTNFERIVYEGYGPGGVAIMAEALTDNRNRTASEIRKIFDRSGGNLGETGCVGWMFEKKGLITVDAEGVDEDELMLVVMEAGADDMERVQDFFEITTSVSVLGAAKTALDEAGYNVKMAGFHNIPKTSVDLDADQGRKILRLVDALDDQDDVQSISANFNVPDEVMAEMAGE
ncbi:MAG: YebC/PmpR family DNA-binding transcriptional regulator [Planctomycetes bacterium]|nr:YebC/PmpR family DNA-binding transcriptional regulator [Planctomycetota bacterium]